MNAKSTDAKSVHMKSARARNVETRSAAKLPQSGHWPKMRRIV
jgi:hypothetical protein